MVCEDKDLIVLSESILGTARKIKPLNKSKLSNRELEEFMLSDCGYLVYDDDEFKE